MLNGKKRELLAMIKIEKRRTALAQQGDLTALARTYTKRTTTKNGNSGTFWDDTFAKEDGENFVERDRNATAYRWLRSIVRPGMHVLNVGCGNGKFEFFFQSEDFKTIEYEGMDIARTSLAKLRRTYPNADFWYGDITTTKLKRKYDGLCIFEVFEHIDTHKVLKVQRKLYDALRPGGFLIAAVPLNEPLLEMFPSNPNRHVRLYSIETLCAELRLAGFEVEKTEEFIAFERYYVFKKLLSKTVLRSRWKPNDLLVLARKSIL